MSPRDVSNNPFASPNEPNSNPFADGPSKSDNPFASPSSPRDAGNNPPVFDPNLQWRHESDVDRHFDSLKDVFDDGSFYNGNNLDFDRRRQGGPQDIQP